MAPVVVTAGEVQMGQASPDRANGAESLTDTVGGDNGPSTVPLIPPGRQSYGYILPCQLVLTICSGQLQGVFHPLCSVALFWGALMGLYGINLAFKECVRAVSFCKLGSAAWFSKWQLSTALMHSCSHRSQFC